MVPQPVCRCRNQRCVKVSEKPSPQFPCHFDVPLTLRSLPSLNASAQVSFGIFLIMMAYQDTFARAGEEQRSDAELAQVEQESI